MGQNKSTNKISRAMPLVHPNAAAIDIGATMRMAAVSADHVEAVLSASFRPKAFGFALQPLEPTPENAVS